MVTSEELLSEARTRLVRIEAQNGAVEVASPDGLLRVQLRAGSVDRIAINAPNVDGRDLKQIESAVQAVIEQVLGTQLEGAAAARGLLEDFASERSGQFTEALAQLRARTGGAEAIADAIRARSQRGHG